MKNIVPRLLTIFVFSLFVSFTFAQKDVGYFKTVSADSLNKILKGKHGMLLDVRTPAEFSKGHLAGAINIDFLDENFNARIDSLDKNKQYILYCHSGGRSSEASEAMKSKGFIKILDLDGGILVWREKGYKVVK